jgi:hypothetical protein
MQISGLEDYFRSEIGRRNGELNVLSSRAASLEQMANARAERLSQLQASTESVVASSLQAQQRIAQSEAQLSAVRSDTLAARIELAAARGEAATIRANFAAQASEFDLLKRQQAYQHASFVVTAMAYGWWEDGEGGEVGGAGASILNAVRNLHTTAETAGLGPYIQQIKTNFERVCPDLATWRMNLPPAPSPPSQPTISYRRGTSPARIAQLTRDAQNRWSNDYAEYLRLSQAHNAALIGENHRLAVHASACVCSSLSDERFSQRDICPSS